MLPQRPERKSPAKKRACSLQIQYQRAAVDRRGSFARRCSNWPSSNSVPLKEPNSGIQAAERADEPEIYGHVVDDVAEPELAREVEPDLSLALYVTERITGCIGDL